MLLIMNLQFMKLKYIYISIVFLLMSFGMFGQHSITGVGIGNVVETQRRLVLDDRVRVLDSILRNWGVDTPWTMQDGNLSFPFHVDRDTASQNPTPRVNNPGTTSVPINGASQLNHMLLQLKQLSS